MILPVAVLAAAALVGRGAATDEWVPLCPPNVHLSQTVERTFGTLRLVVSYREERHPLNGPVRPRCRFRVISKSNKTVAKGEEAWIDEPISADLDGDGVPELIINLPSGGSGGYTTSYVIRQNPPGLLQKIIDSDPLRAEDLDHDGRAELVTRDLTFNMFDDVCNSCSPRPDVHLRLQRGKLRDASPEFAARYDREIAELKSKLRPWELQVLLKARTKDQIYGGVRVDSGAIVLHIIIDYLYSGREQQAWQSLREMWPAWDQERMRKLILATRARGVLSQLH